MPRVAEITCNSGFRDVIYQSYIYENTIIVHIRNERTLRDVNKDSTKIL